MFQADLQNAEVALQILLLVYYQLQPAVLEREAAGHNAAMTTQMTERFSAPGATLVKLFGRPAREEDEFGARAERVAQIGVTFRVVDAKAVDTVKPFLPIIRSGVLMTISKYTADELLSEEGKTKLTKAILVEAIKPFGGSEEDLPEEEDTHSTAKKKKKKAAPEFPVTAVLYSSFIVQ